MTSKLINVNLKVGTSEGEQRIRKKKPFEAQVLNK